MPRYYCDYCDTYLTHDSPSVRKQHNAGYKHKANVRTYYQQFEEQQTQSLIDQRIKEHLGLQQQVGATFNQHLMTLPGAPQRPRLPIMPPPMLPVGAGVQPPVAAPLMPGVRPPILPRPMVAAPGYGAVPTMPPPVALPPGSTSGTMLNSFPRPPTLMPPISGDMGTPVNPGIYQTNPTTGTTSNFEAFNTSSGSGANN